MSTTIEQNQLEPGELTSPSGVFGIVTSSSISTLSLPNDAANTSQKPVKLDNKETDDVTIDNSENKMAPAKSNPTERTGGRKRKNDGTAPPAKRNNAHVSPVIGSSHRRKSQPVKLRDIDKQLTVSTDGNAITSYYAANKEKAYLNCRFKVANVVQRKLFQINKTKVVERTMPEMDDVLEQVTKTAYNNNDLHELGTVNFTKISSWASTADSQNFATDHAAVHSYTLIVDHSDKVKIIENGLASVTLKDVSLSNSMKNIVNMKTVAVTSEEMNNAKNIYYAAVVRRVTSMSDKRVARLPSSSVKKGEKTTISDPATLKHEVRFGCISMYEKDRYNNMHKGILRMILVSKDETPVIRSILSHEEESGFMNEWMKDASNLETLSDLNTVKQDAHLPRLIFETAAENIESTLQATSGPPSQLRIERAGYFNVDGRPIKRENSKSCEAFHLNCFRREHRLIARFPFCASSVGNQQLRFVEGYFQSDKFAHIGDWTYFRPTNDRTIAIAKREIGKKSNSDEPEKVQHSATRNRAPGNRKVYGLNYIQPEGHTPFRKDIHRPRLGKWIPKFKADNAESNDEPMEEDASERNCPTFTLNNPDLMTSIDLRFNKKQNVGPEHRIPGSEMSIVHVPLTEEQKHIFNTQLANTVVKKPLGKPRQKNPDHVVGAPNADLDGRPIPGFFEFFFPQAKSDIYNILLRNYLSEVGFRPGTMTAEMMSRTLIGFLIAHNDMIFEHKLGNIYMKQLQMVGLKTAGWKSEHYTVPIAKYRELRKKWQEKKQQNQT